MGENHDVYNAIDISENEGIIFVSVYKDLWILQ